MNALMPKIVKEQAARKRARAKLGAFIRFRKPQLKVPLHQDKMADIADRVVTGELKRVIINLPPRHLKSETWSIDFPAFYLGHHPHHQVIGTSYGAANAAEFGQEVRNAIDDPDFRAVFPGVGLRKDSKGSKRFKTNKKGVYIATSLPKGRATGKGADLATMDDPHKDFAEGNNLKRTEQAFTWYRQTLYTRLQPDARILLIMQRMSSHDQTARILEQAKEKGEKWEVITFPAIADKDGKAIKYRGPEDLPALRAGIPLWGDHFTLKTLIDIAITVGPSEFMAMYQQEPVTLSGNIIKSSMIRYWQPMGGKLEMRMELPAKFDKIYQSWDLRFIKEERGSYVVGQVWGIKGKDRFLLDQVRGQWGFDESCQNMIALKSKWPLTRNILVEAKANAHAAEDTLGKLMTGIELVNPGTQDKAGRMRATEPDWVNKQVHLPPPETHPWVSGYVDRLLMFPAEPNDEGDATSQFLNFVSTKRSTLKALMKGMENA